MKNIERLLSKGPLPFYNIERIKERQEQLKKLIST